MAKIVLKNVNVTLGGTDISSSVAQVGLKLSVEEKDTTGFGSTAKTRVGGLQDNSVDFEIHQQYSAIESLVYPLIGSTAAVVVKPDGTAVSSANPSYAFNVLVTEWSPVAGAVGDLATASVSWPVDGVITKTVA